MDLVVQAVVTEVLENKVLLQEQQHITQAVVEADGNQVKVALVV
jgi:hypothetical protein